MTKKNLIDLIILNRIFNTGKITLKRKDLNKLIDSELEKGLDEMDTQLVDFCLDVLDGKYGEPYTKNKNNPR